MFYKIAPFLLLLSLGLFLSTFSEPSKVSLPQEKLHIITCDVGQGDAIIIQYKTRQILIDGGKDDYAVIECLKKYLPEGDTVLELVVATHADADHIGGLDVVNRVYKVQTLLWNGIPKNSLDFEEFATSVSQDTRVKVACRGQIFLLSQDIAIKVLHPCAPTEPTLSALLATEVNDEENHNDASVVLELTQKNFSALFTGDLESSSEMALIEGGLLKDIAVLKAGHHGSKTSSVKEFLQKTKPELTLISSGRDNSYGHPHDSVLTSLEEVKSLVLRTDTSGDIVLLSDGYQLGYLIPRATQY